MPELSALELAKELIGRNSVTPQDCGCQQVLAERLKPLGFRCEPMRFEASITFGRAAAARIRWSASPATPTSCPPARSRWHSDPFVPTIRDGKLFGRGAADMKSSIAAFVVAVEAFVEDRPNHSGSIALLITG